jgi:aldose 1-epimerase
VSATGGPVEELRWTSDALEVVVLPGLGCRLHRLRAWGVDLVHHPDDAARHRDRPFEWGAHIMAPWTNRTRAGEKHVAGRTVDLPANFPDGTAIHGQVYLAEWERTAESAFAIRRNGSGWPWPYEASVAFEIAGPALTVALRLTNRGETPMPGGIGLHPWFRAPVQVGVSARRVLPRNDDPGADQRAVTDALRLRQDRPLPQDLDATWIDVEPREVRLRWPSEGIDGKLRLQAAAGVHVAVASPPPPVAVAVEPVTHLPWALDHGAGDRSGGMPLLAAGGTLELAVTLELGRTGAAR